MREDWCSTCTVDVGWSRIAAGQDLSGFLERFVAAHVVGVRRRVDDETDRYVRQLSDLSEKLVADLCGLSVHDEDPVTPDLNCGVTPRPGDHVDPSPDRPYLDARN